MLLQPSDIWWKYQKHMLEERQNFQQLMRGHSYVYIFVNKIRHISFILYTKTISNFKWIENLNTKYLSLKLREENLGMVLYKMDVGKGLLNKTVFAQELKELRYTIDKWYFVKQKLLYTVKKQTNKQSTKQKIQPTNLTNKSVKQMKRKFRVG